MAKGTHVPRKLEKLPCPRCYAPMEGGVCVSKGCSQMIGGPHEVERQYHSEPSRDPRQRR